MKRHIKENISAFFHRHLAKTASYIFANFAAVVSLKSKAKSIDFLLKSLRYYPANKSSLIKVKHCIESGTFERYCKLSPSTTEKDAVGRTVILSEAIIDDGKVVEKGVLLLSFTHTFSFFLKSEQFNKLNELYIFVLEPSWTGYADPDIFSFCLKADDLIIQATDIEDRALINSLFPLVKTIDIGASNWVNDEKFVQLDEDKIFDLLYVANNNPVKRVFHFIDIVSEISDKNSNIKCRLICAGWGGNSHEIEDYIKAKKLERNIILTDGVNQKELVKIYNQSKCSILLSLKEGSNRVLFESMFCNTPVICTVENKGVNKAYINESTGIIAFDSIMKDAIIEMIKNYNNYTPRKWAIQNISSDKSTLRLIETISKLKTKANLKLKKKINDPEVTLKGSDGQKYSCISDLIQ